MKYKIVGLVTLALILTARGESVERKPLREDFDITVERVESSRAESMCFRLTVHNKTDLRLSCDLNAVKRRLHIFGEGTEPGPELGVEGSVVLTRIEPYMKESTVACVEVSPELRQSKAKLRYRFVLSTRFIDENGKARSREINDIAFTGDVTLRK